MTSEEIAAVMLVRQVADEMLDALERVSLERSTLGGASTNRWLSLRRRDANYVRSYAERRSRHGRRLLERAEQLWANNRQGEATMGRFTLDEYRLGDKTVALRDAETDFHADVDVDDVDVTQVLTVAALVVETLNGAGLAVTACTPYEGDEL